MTFQSRRNSANKDLCLLYALLLSIPLLFASACGGGSSSGGGTPPSNPTITSVTASCTPTSVQTGQTSQCSPKVSGTGSYSSAVIWSAVSGTISSSGLYTAPAYRPGLRIGHYHCHLNTGLDQIRFHNSDCDRSSHDNVSYSCLLPSIHPDEPDLAPVSKR